MALTKHMHESEASNAQTHKIKLQVHCQHPAKEDTQHWLSDVSGQALASRRPDERRNSHTADPFHRRGGLTAEVTQPSRAHTM